MKRIFIILVLTAMHTSLMAMEGVQVKVATFNIWDKPVLKSKHSKARVLKFCQLIQDNLLGLDVIGIQELWRKKSLKRVLKCIKKAKIKIYHLRDRRGFSPFFWQRNGLLILSRYPIKKLAQVSFRPHERRYQWKTKKRFRKDISEILINKGFFHFQIEVKKNNRTFPIHLYNTHLAANFGKKNRQHRLRKFQLNFLINYIKLNSSNMPTILMGDLNFAINGLKEKPSDPGPGSSLHRLIQNQLGFIQAPNYPAHDPRSFHTFSLTNFYNDENQGQLDHIFCGVYGESMDSKIKIVDSGLILHRPFEFKRKKINLSDHYGFYSTCYFNL